MTLASAVVPLAAYAIAFQTVLYLSLPSRLRTLVAPVVTGVIGAGLTVAAGLIFGFETIGLGSVGGTEAISWAVATGLVVSIIGTAMLTRTDLRAQLADPRLAEMSGPKAFIQIFIRIPVFTALIEEAFFRGVLHAALMAIFPLEIAIWLGAGLFGMWHVGPGLDQARAGNKTRPASALHTAITVVATTIAGVFLVWLRVETGSIWAPVAVHAGINMTMALFARFAGRINSADAVS